MYWSLFLGHCLGFVENATTPRSTLLIATSAGIMTSNNDSNPAATIPSTETSGSLDFNYTVVDSMSANDDRSAECYVGPDGVTLLCEENNDIHSPFATCEEHFVPLFAKKLKDVYTVCCNETDFAKGTVFDVGGFGCCSTTYQVACEHAHSVTGCLSDQKHNITQEEVQGVQVCKGEAARNLERMLKGFVWMMLLWALCISGFWCL